MWKIAIAGILAYILYRLFGQTDTTFTPRVTPVSLPPSTPGSPAPSIPVPKDVVAGGLSSNVSVVNTGQVLTGLTNHDATITIMQAGTGAVAYNSSYGDITNGSIVKMPNGQTAVSYNGQFYYPYYDQTTGSYVMPDLSPANLARGVV